MSGLFALCRKEWWLLLRDPHGLLVLFAVPALFILIMSLALRDAFSAERPAQLSLAIENADGGELSRRLEQSLASLPTFAAGPSPSPQVRVRLLPGFSELLATRFEFAPEYLAGDEEPALIEIQYAATLIPQARLGARLAVQQAVQIIQSDFLLLSELELSQDKADALRYVSDPRRLPLTESVLGGAGRALPSAVQQSVPAWLIFALFFSVIPLSGSLVTERQEGSLLRLRVLDVAPAKILGAKALAFYAVHLLQTAVMLTIGAWLVPLLGGDALAVPFAPLAIVVVASATSVAALGLALLVGVCVRTPTQAIVGGGASTLLLSALGGILVPKLVMPPAMQTVADLVPTGWALEAWWSVLLHPQGGSLNATACAALVGFGLATLALAAILFSKEKDG